MSQTPIKVEYPLEEVLGELKQSIKEVNHNVENLQKDINQNSLINEISNLKGVKSLVIPIVVAVSTALLTLLVRLIPTVSP